MRLRADMREAITVTATVAAIDSFIYDWGISVPKNSNLPVAIMECEWKIMDLPVNA